VIEHVITDGDNAMQSNSMHFQHPQGAVLEWPENIHEVLDDVQFILCCEDWPVITQLWINNPLMGEFL